MGYYVDMIDCKITIPRKNYSKAIQIFKDLMSQANNNGRGGRYGPGGCEERWYSWVDTKKAIEHLNSTDTQKGLLLFFTEWGYVFEDTDDGLSLAYKEVDKWGDDEALISSLSLVVNDNNYIRFRGEEGYLFGFKFEEGMMYGVQGRIIWDMAIG